MPTRPMASTAQIPPNPARSAPNTAMNVPKNHGARNDAARPVVVYSPNATPSLPSVVRRSICVRAADWVGPTKRHSSSPQIQNEVAPSRVSRTSAVTIRALKDPTMTGLDPRRSSSRPPITEPIAAITQAHTPNSRTSAGDTPYTVTPTTAPNVNTPVSPSRNTALAAR